jgi:adenylate cyclase
MAITRTWLGKTWLIHRIGFWLSLALTLLVLILAWMAPAAMTRWENVFLDFRFRLRGEQPANPNVLIVAIDEKSLAEIGRWPWSRAVQARLVEALARDGAKVIALDLLYPEAETSESLTLLHDLARLPIIESAASPDLRSRLHDYLRQSAPDQRLAEAIRGAGRVVLAYSLIVPESRKAAESRAVASPDPPSMDRFRYRLVRQSTLGETQSPYRATSRTPPQPQFLETAASLGHVYSLPEPDGITRYEYLSLQYGEQDAYYPALALETARLALGYTREQVALVLGEGVTIGNALVPTDQRGRLLINFYGREGSFRTISAADVLHNRIPAEQVRNRIVLVGTTALGTYDQKSTPFSANFPGVEKNATVVANILDRSFLEKSLWTGPLDKAVIALSGLALGLILPRVRALTGAAVTVSALIGFALTAHSLFVWRGIWLDMAYPLLTIALIFVANTVLKFSTEERQAKEIRAMFSSYVSPRIVEELIKDPGNARLGGQRKECTLLFADLFGFTAFSAERSAEEVVQVLNEYLGAMTDVIFRWNGTLDKFVGDSIVAFWGAPLDQPNHVELATRCALHMRARMEQLREKWQGEGRALLETGIGLNTGEVVVGNMGADGKKMDYTVIGDHVNLTARVEGLTRQFQIPIVITEYTAERLRPYLVPPDGKPKLGHLECRKIGAVKVKGRPAPVVVYGLRPLPEGAPATLQEEAMLTEVLEMKDK